MRASRDGYSVLGRLLIPLSVVIAVLLLFGPLGAARGQSAAGGVGADDASASTWNILLIVFPETDADYMGLDGEMHHMRASMSESEIEAMLGALRGPVAAAVSDWSAGVVQWQIDVVRAGRPVSRLSDPDPYRRQWLDPASIDDVISGYSPNGKYDQVMVYWKNTDGSAVIPSWGWGLALPSSATQAWGYATVTSIPATRWSQTIADFWGQIWIHEWLHCACAFYASRGYPMPVGDADGAEYHGYVEDLRGLPGLAAYYSDLMQGKVLEGKWRLGITREAWLSGSIADAAAAIEPPSTTTTTLAPTKSFSDVSPTHPFYEQISVLAARSIVNGFSDGTFRPDSLVMRQQFAKMIARASGLAVTGSEVCTFGDVVRSTSEGDPLYPDKYVAACAAAGITVGVTAAKFDPYRSISRQQLITMVARAARLEDPPPEYAPSFAPSQFTTAEHYANARKALFHGLLGSLTGLGGTYDFLLPATRVEVCAVLYDLLGLGSCGRP